MRGLFILLFFSPAAFAQPQMSTLTDAKLGDYYDDGFSFKLDLGLAMTKASAGTSVQERDMAAGEIGILLGYRFKSFTFGGVARHALIEQRTPKVQVQNSNLKGVNSSWGLGIELPLFWRIRAYYYLPLQENYQLALSSTNQEEVTYSSPDASSVFGMTFMLADLLSWGGTLGLSVEMQSRTFSKVNYGNTEYKLDEKMVVSGFGTFLTYIY